MIKFFHRQYDVKQKAWKVIRAEIDFDSDQYKIAVKQAEKKSKYTMSASQSGEMRDQIVKYNMQLMGIVAEIACKEYLEKVLKNNLLYGDWNVERYDDVRTDDFKSSKNEYDLKLYRVKNSENNIFAESRSSISYNKSFEEALENYDIIGPYTSCVKFSERLNDIYLRPLYEYVNYKNRDYSKENFEMLLRTGIIILYLVAGCTQEDLYSNGIVKSMGQGKSIFKVLPILKSTDIIDFQNTLLQLLKNK